MNDVIKDPRWVLTIRTFEGIVPGASHYQGEIERSCYKLADGEPEDGGAYWSWRERCAVERQIDASTARRLSTSDFGYQEGWYSDRCFSEEEVLSHVEAVFKLVAAEGDFLVYDDPDPDYDDRPVLAGSADGYDFHGPGRTVYNGKGPRDIIHDVEDLLDPEDD